MGYYTPKRSHLKIAVLPQREAFSADFAGRRSICALRRAKITEGALHGRFGAVFEKETWPPHSLNPAAAEAARWPPRAKL